ncbi:MAG: DUF2339 domain-containing protein [Opitutae bacterium]|nr:DUF2339 domain-containing protein [Opitutae bacterium]
MNANTPRSPQSSPVPREDDGVLPAAAPPEFAPGDPTQQTQRFLEARLTRLENYLGFRPLVATDVDAILSGTPAPKAPFAAPEVADEGLEREIGEFWLARVGVLALSLGLAFLVAYPLEGLPAIVSCLIGYAAAAAFFTAAHRWRQSLPDTARILFGGALFLLYFATLRLHFFSARPVVASFGLGLALVVLVNGIEFYIAARRRSQVVAGLVLGLGFATAVVADAAWLQLGCVVLLAATVYALVRLRGWPWLGLVAIALTYLFHLDWLLNHPLLGRAMHGVTAPQGNLVALAAYAVIFAALGCRPEAPQDHVALRIGRALLISGGTMLIALINVQLFHATQPPWVETAVAGAMLAAAIVYWWHHQSIFTTSIFACAGYLMLSVAIFRYFPAPDFYAWLAWQSLLVAVTAVWFRSKIVIVANLFIFGGIYLAYLLLGSGAGPVNLSFAVVALLTARVLNWQKDRLSLHTEFMRNVYLGAASVVIPYGLYHTVPKGWVSVSWLVTAGLYFVASSVLQSRKYRWMGIGTILATILYVFVVDLARLPPAYRIMSFLVLGVVLLGISIAYTVQRRKGSTAPLQE